MFERFTEDGADVVRLASDEARDLSHARIGTEHLLLAFVRKPDLLPAIVLASLGVDEAAVRTVVEERFPHGSEPRPSGQIPFTPEAKKSLELGLREALALGHNHIASAHLLLGLVRVDEGGAAQILAALDVDTGRLRDELRQRMPARRPRGARRGRRSAAVPRRATVEWAPVPSGTGWEYRVERPAGEIATDWLNALGAERWELVGPAPPELGGGLIFKRQRPHMYRAADPPPAEPGDPA